MKRATKAAASPRLFKKADLCAAYNVSPKTFEAMLGTGLVPEPIWLDKTLQSRRWRPAVIARHLASLPRSPRKPKRPAEEARV